MREDSQVAYDLETQKLRCEQAWLRFKLAIYDLVLGKPAPEAKFNPYPYHDELGRFTFAPGGAGGGRLIRVPPDIMMRAILGPIKKMITKHQTPNLRCLLKFGQGSIGLQASFIQPPAKPLL